MLVQYEQQDVTRLHQALIDQLKARGYISTPAVEAAFRAVPRHLFLPELPPHEVYLDRAIATKSIDGEFVSSSSQPSIMAIMLEQLQLQAGQRVLEIGAGTGYNAALMAHIVGETGQVVTIDIDDDLVESAHAHLAVAGFDSVQVICGDGGLGYRDAAPYDRIILTVNASDIAPAWLEQLRPDGRLLLPLVVRGPQVAVAFEWVMEHLESVSARACGFIGLRGIFAEPNIYVQLAPEPGNYLRLGERRPIDVTSVQHLLRGPSHDRATQIQVTNQELGWSLIFWLALHEPLICELAAYDYATASSAIPSLLHFPGRVPSTVGLVNDHALSILFNGSQQAPPVSSPFPYPLYIRTYGSDDTLAQQLFRQVVAWHRAGRLQEMNVHIRAYPHGIGYVAYEHDVLLIKAWTLFAFNVPHSGSW